MENGQFGSDTQSDKKRHRVGVVFLFVVGIVILVGGSVWAYKSWFPSVSPSGSDVARNDESGSDGTGSGTENEDDSSGEAKKDDQTSDDGGWFDLLMGGSKQGNVTLGNVSTSGKKGAVQVYDVLAALTK